MEEEHDTTTEERDEYIKEIEEAIGDCSAHEKNIILLKKLRYWFWSAIDWRNCYEEKRDECLKILEEANK